MTFKIGQVYRDVASGASFIIVLEGLNSDTHEMAFRMVNATNWIMLQAHRGKQLPSGEISCPDLKPEDYVLLAPSVRAYYKTDK